MKLETEKKPLSVISIIVISFIDNHTGETGECDEGIFY